MSYWVAGAAVVGAVGGSLIGSNAAKGAAKTQANASATAVQEQQRQYDLQRTDSAPYRAAGVDALGQLQTGINAPVTSADVMSDPGYQFGLQQGQAALDRKTAAMGGRVSGAALKGADRYATDYATTGYNAAYQRRQDRLNRLSALAGIGQTATSASSAAGAQSANAISGIISSQGDASAANRLAQGSIWGGAGNQLAAVAQRYYTPSSPGYSYSSGGVGTGGYSSGGQSFNNPSAYVAPGG